MTESKYQFNNHNEENGHEEQLGQPGKYSSLTNMKLFDSLSLSRKIQAQENLSQITKFSDKQFSPSPYKEQQINKNEDFVQQQIQEISKLKKDNLHFLLKNQELENYKAILEDQLSQKNQYSLEKESRLGDEINKYRDENSLLKSKILKIENELRDQDENLYQFKKLKEKEIEQQKLTLLHQNESQLNKEIKDLSNKFSQEKQIYNSEINKGKEMIQIYQEEIKILQNQNKDQQQIIISLKKLEDKLKEKENIVMCLHQEIDSKIEQLDKKNHEYENIKIQYRDLDNLNNNQQKEYQLNSQKKEIILQENEKQITKLKKERDSLLVVQQKFYDGEIQIQSLNNDTKKLNSIINDRNYQLDNFTNLYQNAQNQLKKLEEENQKIQDKLELTSQELELSQSSLKQKKEDYQKLQQKLKDLEIDFQQFKSDEGKHSLMREEQINILNHENSQYKEKLQDSQVFIQQQTNLIQQQQQSLASQSQKQINMASDIKSLQEQNSNKQIEIDELTTQVQKYKPYQGQSQQQEQQLDLLLQEIERLNRLLIDYINENESLSKQKSELQRYVSWFKEKDAEVQQLDQEIKYLIQKNQQLTKLQFQYNDQDNDIKSQKVELERLIHQVQNKNKEISILQSKVQEQESQTLHLRNDLKYVSNYKIEIERLQLSLKQKEQELEKQQDHTYENQLLKKKQQKNLIRLQDNQSLISVLYQQIEQLQRKNTHDQKN